MSANQTINKSIYLSTQKQPTQRRKVQ